jgi:N-methylhydantoinase B
MEGLQFNQLKIYEGGKLNEMLNRMIRDNIRFPEASMGDMRSQIAACRLAGQRMDELFSRYGKEAVLGSIQQVFADSEQKCRNVVSRLKDGVYEAESFIDDDATKPVGRIRIHTRVTVDKGHMTIDLSGCGSEAPNGYNSRTYAGALIAYKALTGPLEPVNEGAFRALDVVIPEGNMMMARYPLPMASWSPPLPTVADTVLAALAPAMADEIPAAHHGSLGGIAFFGVDPKTNKRFLVQSIEGGGWGGRPREDGPSGSVSICQGDVRNGTIEGIEMKCPVMIESRALRPDSGGAGKHRGGLGIEFRLKNFVEGRWNFARPSRIDCPAWPLWGGKPGATPEWLLRRPGENDFKTTYGHRYPVPANSEVIMLSSGGGGWGDPLERPAAVVREDVLEGYITSEAARADYGVVLDARLALDAAATEALRQELRGTRPTATVGHTTRDGVVHTDLTGTA